MKKKDPTYHLEEWVGPVVVAIGTQTEMEDPMAMVVVYIEEETEKEMETPQ